MAQARFPGRPGQRSLIPVAEPNLTGKEQEYVRAAIASGWVSGGGPFVERFENMVARATEREWCVATVTGTAALHVALAAVGVNKTSYVTLPSYTFIASANAISYLGAEVRFTDRPPVWSIDATLLVPDRGLAVCDAAPGIGNPEATSQGWLATLSFNGNKTVTTGQGGAVVGDDRVLEERVRHLIVTAKTGHYKHDAVGFNYRMSNINAAMGCAQMERLDYFVARKEAILKRYREAGIKLLPSTWMAVALMDRQESETFETKPFYVPLHLQEPYKDCKRTEIPEMSKTVCLPCSTGLSEAEQDEVIKCVESWR